MKTVEYISKLVEEMNDETLNWTIKDVVEVEEVQKHGETYGKIKGTEEHFEKQGDEYIRQRTGYLGDDYYGFILKPIEGKKYLKIYYEC